MGFNCRCGRKFKSLYLLLRHMVKTIHGGSQAYWTLKAAMLQAKNRNL